MKKALALIATAATYGTGLVTKVFADDNNNTGAFNVSVTTPDKGLTTRASDIGKVIGNGLIIVYSLGALLVLFFIILGAFNWITSGGDKEKVKSARGQIVNALIGLALLALAALITNVVARLLGFGDVLNFNIPTLNSNTTGAPLR